MKLHVIRLEETASTSAVLRDMLADAPHATVVTTRRQTAGRGQRGNSWESEPGKNLTFSVLVRPRHIMARDAFVISAAVANAIYDFTLRMSPGADVSVKWPNDIYLGDGKLCGVLIENTLEGARVASSIIGTGYNVLQERFLSDAPNPVSLGAVDGLTLDEMETRLCEMIVEAVERAEDPEAHADILATFNSRLYRRDGRQYPFREPGGEPFMARVEGTEPSGHLLLSVAGEAAPRRYAFKEVEHIVPVRPR